MPNAPVSPAAMERALREFGRVVGQDWLLAERTDLAPTYVQQVVRRGLLGMPAITRVDLSDIELARVIAYLTRPRPAAPPAAGQ
jgi:hypothetical protein